MQMLLTLIFSRFYSKRKYYKHRIITQFIITFLTTIIDVKIVIENRDDIDLSLINIMIYFLTIIIDTIVIAYKHYLFEIRFFSIDFVSFIFGFFNFIFMVLLIIIKSFYKNFLCINNWKENFCPKFLNFDYEALKDWIIIICSFLLDFCFFLLVFYFIKNYTPNHVFITYIIYIFFSNVEYIYDEENKILSLIIFSLIFVIVFICFLVYLELLELNFCELNKDTRRNILKREKEEIMDIRIDLDKEIDEDEENDDVNKSQIEIVPGYAIHYNDNIY